MTPPASSRRAPILGCIADDVTGATDLAINLVGGGMRVVQILGVPEAGQVEAAAEFDAIVVALKTRSIPPDQAVEQSLQARRRLADGRHRTVLLQVLFDL